MPCLRHVQIIKQKTKLIKSPLRSFVSRRWWLWVGDGGRRPIGGCCSPIGTLADHQRGRPTPTKPTRPSQNSSPQALSPSHPTQHQTLSLGEPSIKQAHKVQENLHLDIPGTKKNVCAFRNQKSKMWRVKMTKKLGVSTPGMISDTPITGGELIDPKYPKLKKVNVTRHF